MKLVTTLCGEIRYKEFPDLLFGKSCDNSIYFDSTHYIQANGDVRKHSVKILNLDLSIGLMLLVKLTLFLV